MAAKYNYIGNRASLKVVGWNSGNELPVTSLSGPTISRAAVDTTSRADYDATDEVIYRTFAPGSIDMGTVSGEVSYDPGMTPPYKNSAATVTVSWAHPDYAATDPNMTCSGFLTDFTPTGGTDGHLVASFTLKLTGEPTWNQGTSS